MLVNIFGCAQRATPLQPKAAAQAVLPISLKTNTCLLSRNPASHLDNLDSMPAPEDEYFNKCYSFIFLSVLNKSYPSHRGKGQRAVFTSLCCSHLTQVMVPAIPCRFASLWWIRKDFSASDICT